MKLQIANRFSVEMILDIYNHVNVKIRGAGTSIAVRLAVFGRKGWQQESAALWKMTYEI